MIKKTLRLMRDAAYTRHDILVDATGGGEEAKDEHRAFVDRVYMPCFALASLVAYDLK